MPQQSIFRTIPTRNRQTELFPDHKRIAMERLVSSLLAGIEKLNMLGGLVDEVRANPKKRSYSLYHVKNADGSIYRRAKR